MTSNMSEDRRKEIALLIVEQLSIERGIPGADVMKRDIGNQAQKIGVSTQELMDFYESLLPRVIARMFGYNHVSLNTIGPGKKFEINKDQ